MTIAGVAVTSPEHAITITRTFDAPASELYAAWTDLPTMRRWLGEDITADVRVGGRYRIVVSAEGRRFVNQGEYVNLEPDRRVVLTFQGGPEEDADVPPPGDYQDEFISFTFNPLSASQTELTFVNGWNGEAIEAEGMAALREGWSGWLDQLAVALAAPRTN